MSNEKIYDNNENNYSLLLVLIISCPEYFLLIVLSSNIRWSRFSRHLFYNKF